MPGGRRQVLLERPLQMGLIGETGLMGDLGDQPAAAQLRAGIAHPLIEQVTVGRQAEVLLEGADQVGRR